MSPDIIYMEMEQFFKAKESQVNFNASCVAVALPFKMFYFH